MDGTSAFDSMVVGSDSGRARASNGEGIHREDTSSRR